MSPLRAVGHPESPGRELSQKNKVDIKGFVHYNHLCFQVGYPHPLENFIVFRVKLSNR